jgi:hypothetical protein
LPDDGKARDAADAEDAEDIVAAEISYGGGGQREGTNAGGNHLCGDGAKFHEFRRNIRIDEMSFHTSSYLFLAHSPDATGSSKNRTCGARPTRRRKVSSSPSATTIWPPADVLRKRPPDWATAVKFSAAVDHGEKTIATGPVGAGLKVMNTQAREPKLAKARAARIAPHHMIRIYTDDTLSAFS